MLKHVAGVMVLVLVLQYTAPALGQTACPELDGKPDLKRSFVRQAITLDVRGESIGSRGFFSTVDYSSWDRWQAHEGGEPLTEEQLFVLCGYSEEAEKARQHKSSASSLMGGGIVLALIGCVVALIGTNKKTTQCDHYTYIPDVCYEVVDPNYGMVYGGLIVGVIGTGMMWAGSMKTRTNAVPYGQVKMVVDEYNENLCRRLAGE